MRPTVFSAPDRKAWNYESEVYVNGARQATYSRNESIAFPVDGAYTAVEGVITFRSGNFRNNASYGTAALSKRTFTSLWNIKIGSIDSGYAEWSGVGWTGQPVLVRWDKQTRSIMNLKTEFKNKSSLIEVIYGTLDGNIYFLDAETGKYTREPINLGFPIKGSVSVDPRGYPLLYVGQGISVANGVTGDIGWYIYSLIDGRRLFFLDGRDKLCYRKHGAFDGSCLIDAKTDTAVIGAENGILYTVKLNTYYNPNTPTISVKPVVTALRYKSADIEELGFECSVAACGQYAFLADNSGLLTCFDLNTLEPAWFFNLGDDTDSTITLEADGDRLWLYTVNEVDKQGDSGVCTIRKLNALTGEQVWSYNEICTHDGTNGGGGFASPVLGANEYADYIYFNLCRTTKGGKLYCFDKRTGRSIWQIQLGSNSWSSPVIVYRKDGTGVLILAGGKGELRMYNPLTGDKYSEIMLEGKIEASPAVFGDILVIGTRGKRIYGIRLS
ncbi:MAG: PQQ-binding-like beta-propeller repeat protein [Clostridia bacterium]|nr:PQQ-binding-like beta-propeller repeat protein [Clostridia bacterium]